MPADARSALSLIAVAAPLTAATAAPLTAATAAPLAAQEPRSQELPDTVAVEADSVRYVLEGLVVTAHRVPVPREKVASRVTVIRGEELEARGIHFVSDALREVAGAVIAESGPFGSLTSLFLRGGQSDYVRVLVDGVPLNDPGGAFDFADLTTDNVQRIEVLRGPGSVLYGSDAVAGVVQIFTRRGRGAPRARAGFRGGSFGTALWEGGLSGGGEVAEYAFSVSRFASDGPFERNDEYRNGVASGRVAVRPDDRTEAALTLRYGDSEFHFPTDGAGRPVDENQFQTRQALALGLEVARRLPADLALRLHLTARESDLGIDDRPDGPADTLGFFAFASQQDQSRHALDLRLDYRPAPATVLTVGGGVEEETVRSITRSESEFGSSSAASDEGRTNGSVYGEALVDVGGGIALSLGARLDANDRFGSFGTYRAGAVYRLPTGTGIRASWGRSFKEPTFVENFAEGFARGNPDLDPERSRSWEVGADQELWDGRLVLAATWFDQGFRDLIQFTPTPAEPGGPNFFNVARARSDGLEAEVRLRAGGLFLDAAYTLLDAEVENAGFDEGPDATFVEGETLLRRPEHAGSLVLGYRASRIGGSVAVRRVGARDDLDFSGFPAERLALPSYTTVNLSLEGGLLPVGGGLPDVRPIVRIENLFDREYEQIVNFPARGRTVFVGARASLGS